MKKLIRGFRGDKLLKITKKLFEKFEKKSIDFAVMEKSKIIKCIPVRLGWNDVGNFTSLEEIFEKDEFKNITKNVNYIYLDSENNIIISDKANRLISTIGISNMVIIDSNEALLICRKDDLDKIKKLLKKVYGS